MLRVWGENKVFRGAEKVSVGRHKAASVLDRVVSGAVSSERT